MKIVFDFVQGKLSYDEFENEFVLEPEIWTWIQSLVPNDISNKNCTFRSIYRNMQGFETNNYNVKSTIMSFGYDSEYGRITAFTLISALVKYHYPDIVCKEPLQYGTIEFLEKVDLEYIGGSEVTPFIRNIISAQQDLNNKKIKSMLKDYFHLSPRKYPDWVQEPEWPATSEGVPMIFVSQKRTGELYEYTFKHPETGELRVVEQYT